MLCVYVGISFIQYIFLSSSKNWVVCTSPLTRANWTEPASLAQLVACSGLLSRVRRLDSRVRHIHSLAVIDWFKDEHWVLVNRLG